MENELNTLTLEEPAILKIDRDGGSVPPLFVVGVWRSGTTLLYTLLNQHPDIRLFFEGDLAVLAPMFRVPWGRKAWVDKWEYWNAGVSRHDLDPGRLTSPVNSLAEATELAGREYAAKKGAKIWGCKSPSYYNQLVPLAREFPKARFVVIWRDPEEVIRSVIHAAGSPSGQWFGRPGMTHKALLAAKTLKEQCDKLLSMGASLHQIYFRDLIEKTDNTMRGICKFLEIPFNPAVTMLDGADRSAVYEGPHHALAKANRIVSKREPRAELPTELSSKIQRYKALWKAEAGDNWILSQHFSEPTAKKPGLWERSKDRIQLWALCLWDSAPRFCYSLLPRRVWETYRRLKYPDPNYVHRHLTNKPTTLRSNSSSPAVSPVSSQKCAVRLGKVLLQSVEVDELLSNNSDQLKHIVTVNSEIFTYAHENPAFEAVLQRTVNTIDGRIVQLLASLVYPGSKLRKAAGSDFIYNLAGYASKHGERVFLLGAGSDSNRGTIQALKTRWPELVIDGYSPAFCSDIQDREWNADILSRIACFGPTHLVVCFGPVKQEMWISQSADRLFQLGIRCAYGMGGTLDFVSGIKKRAPKWVQKVGAEWLFRLLCEPRQRFGRTAKMFKMPYFAMRFYNREIRILAEPNAMDPPRQISGAREC